MEFLNSSTVNANALIGFKDPFQKDKVQGIHFQRYTWHDAWEASVSFVNGKTSGSQKFENNDLFALIKEVQQFVDSLHTK